MFSNPNASFEDLPLYYRSATGESEENSLRRRMRLLKASTPLGRSPKCCRLPPQELSSNSSKTSPNPVSFWRVWDFYNYLVNYDTAPAILASKLEEEGKAVLLTSVKPIYGEPCYCDTHLLRKGIIKKFNTSTYSCETTLNTDFIIPETCYDPNYKNPILPPKGIIPGTDEEIENIYCELLSNNAVVTTFPKKMSSSMFLRMEDSVKKEEKPKGLKSRASKRLYKDYVVRCSFNDEIEEFPEFVEQQRQMNTSSAATQRVATEIEPLPGDCLKPSFPGPSRIRVRPPKIPSSLKVEPDITPRPVQDCNMSYYFWAVTQKSLSDYCSYAYQDDQFPSFECGTNHVINGNVVGGFNMALYYDDAVDIKREMLVENPQVHVTDVTFIMYLAFACLYPATDSENWRKYAVCTSPLKYSTVYRALDPFLDASNQLFTVYPDYENPSEYHRPYCSATVPSDISCNNNVLSYVRYLPSESGMIDVHKEGVQIYTQIRIFISHNVRVEDTASTTERIGHARAVFGTPQEDSDKVGNYNLIYFPQIYGNYSNGNVFEQFIKYGSEYSLVYNDLAYIQSLSCTPSDFVVKKSEESEAAMKTKGAAESRVEESGEKPEKGKKENKGKEGNGSLVSRISLVRAGEAPHLKFYDSGSKQ